MANLLNIGRGLVNHKFLPYDAEIEYLESTGTQWINTLVKPNNTYTFDCKVAVLQDNYNCVYWGCRNSGTYQSSNEQCYLNSNTTLATTYLRRIRLFTTYTDSLENWDSGITPVVGVMYDLVNITVVSSLNALNYPIILFGFNNIGSINSSAGMCRIGGWTAYSNGVKVADFIPVVKDNVPCMYDKVSKQLFYNQGTGSFIAGPRIS